MEEIRSWWEVPCIAHFCSLFRAAFGLTDFEIEDLEDALAIDGAVEDSRFLADLQARLLRGIFGKKHDINAENFEPYLSELVRVRWEEELGKFNPLKEKEYKSLLPREKVEILHSLCDWRLDADDVSDLLKGLEADSLRVEALGYDAQGHTYWYFYGTRLYKEEKIVVEPVKKDKKKKVKGKKRKKKIKKKKQKKKTKKKKQTSSDSDFETSSEESSEIESSEEESDEEEQSTTDNEEEPRSVVKWSLVCSTAEEWEQLAEVFKKSKQRDEKALFQTLTVDFLPEIEKMIEAKEKAAKKKFLLEMVPRRQSGRLALKTQAREEEELEDELEREKEAEERKKEEEEREKEREKLAEKRKSERAERARLREERQWLMASGELPPEVATALVQNKEEPNPTDEVREKKRSTPIDDEMDRDEDLYTGLYKVIDAVKKHHNAWPFLEPVDESFAPQYFDIVENPMDLSLMEEKLDESKYKSLAEFVEDFKLMLSNCLEYNGPDSMYTKMAHSLEAAFTRLIGKHFPEDDDQDDWDFEEEFSKSKRKKKKLNRKNFKSIDEYISATPKMTFDPTSKMFVPEGERRDLPQRPNNLPLPMFNNMGMSRMPNGSMFPPQHPNMPFHGGSQPQFGNPGLYPPQLYQNSMPPQFAYGYGNPAQMGQMGQMNPRSMPPNFHSQTMGYPRMAGQQMMGQRQMQGGGQPIGMTQNQPPGPRMPLGVGQNQMPGQPGMPGPNQLPPGHLAHASEGQPLPGVDQGHSPHPNQGHHSMTGQSQIGQPKVHPNQVSKSTTGPVSSSTASFVQSPSTSSISSPSVGTTHSPATQQEEDKSKGVTSPSTALSPVATSGEATPPSWTAGPSREITAAPQQYPGQKPPGYMQHPAYAQMQQNPYYRSNNPAYRHPMATYGGPQGGSRPMWDPSMGQFSRQFHHMRPQDDPRMQNGPRKPDQGRSIDLSQTRYNAGPIQQMSSPGQPQNYLPTQGSTPTRSVGSPSQKSDSESKESSQSVVNEKIGVQGNSQQDATQENRQPPDQRQYSAVVPERELASMRQGMMPSPKQPSQFMDHQRAKVQPPFGHSKSMFGSTEQPLRKLEEMAVNKETGSRATHIVSPDHSLGDQSRQKAAGNTQANPAPNSSPADQEISFPFMMTKNGQHQAGKDNRDSDSTQERPISSPRECNTAPRKPMSKFISSPEHINSNKQSLASESRNGNSSMNGVSLLGNTNGSSQSSEETVGKQKGDNSGRLGVSQSQNYIMNSTGSYSNHSISAHLNPHKERTIPESLDKEETPSSRNTSMISYLKELSSWNPMDPMSMQSSKPQSEQSMLNSNAGASDPSKSRDTTRIGPPPPLQMHSSDLHLGLSYPSSVPGGQGDLPTRHHQMSSSLQGQRTNAKEEEHGRSFGSMYLDLDQRQANQSLVNLDKSVPYHHPQSMYTPHEALRRQQMFMMQRQMQVQDMGSFMSSPQPGRLPMDFGILQQPSYRNASYALNLGRNGEFPGPFSTPDMSTKPRFS